jgi:hypothetical protein
MNVHFHKLRGSTDRLLGTEQASIGLFPAPDDRDGASTRSDVMRPSPDFM